MGFETIIGLVAGAVGGNVPGMANKNMDMGVLVNSLAGVAGGGIGSIATGAMGLGGDGGFNIESIITEVAGGGVGGAVLIAVVGLVKNAMNK